MKTLIFDIESAPMLAYIWQAKTEYVHSDAITHESFLLSWAAKWHDGKRIYGAVLTPDEAKAQDDSRIVGSLADMVREADMVVAHNISRFDMPKLNTRVMLLDQEPIGSVKEIDTLTLSRRSFRLASNRLDYLAQLLGVGGKLPTNFELWKRAYRGEAKALREMYTYNRNDVTILENVYEALKPYVKGLPRLVDADHEGQQCCPHCGGKVHRDGVYRTNASTFIKWRCQNQECRRNSRSRKADNTKKLDLVPVT